MLTYIGGRKQRPRQTLLEVVVYDPAADIYIVGPGPSMRFEWFRTIQRNPHVLVDVRDRRFEAVAADMSEVEAKHALWGYACRYPFALRNVTITTTGQHVIGMCGDYRSLAYAIRLVALRPLHGDQPLRIGNNDQQERADQPGAFDCLMR